MPGSAEGGSWKCCAASGRTASAAPLTAELWIFRTCSLTLAFASRLIPCSRRALRSMEGAGTFWVEEVWTWERALVDRSVEWCLRCKGKMGRRGEAGGVERMRWREDRGSIVELGQQWGKYGQNTIEGYVRLQAVSDKALSF